MAKVLLIDDEEGFTNLVKANLSLGGKHEVHAVNDPLQALDAALSFEPEIIILDLIMPGMDGGDVAARFREKPELADIPIIFLTALVSPSEVAPGTVAQSGDYPLLPKPVDINLLERAIKENLRSSQGE